MDIKEYISSGIIESYVLGLANEEEARQLEQLCLQYPEISAALEEAQLALERYAQLHSQPVPEHLKEKVMETLEAEGMITADKTRKLSPERKPINIYAYIAAACILLLLLGCIYHLRTVNKLKAELLLMANQQRTLSAENANYKTQALQLSTQLAQITKPTIKKFDLEGVPGHENNTAYLYWDTATKEVFLQPSKLTSLPAGKQYQLWAIVDGKPVSVGVFNEQNLTAIQQMDSVQRAEMFAITIEKAGGVASPTLDQMVVAKKI